MSKSSYLLSASVLGTGLPDSHVQKEEETQEKYERA